MSSVLRTTIRAYSHPTKFVGIETPSYTDSGLGTDLLFPFTVEKGILDLADQNSFVEDMIDTSNVDPSKDSDVLVKVMGSPIAIRGIGERVKEYIRAWKDGSIDNDSEITLYQPTSAIKVVCVIPGIDLGDIYYEADTPPSNEDYLSFNSSSNYGSTYVFHRPCTIVYKYQGNNKYVTFYSMFSED